ncbi:MAG TPA: hypothetical protein VKM55_04500 [Candidatus Lokiarchaeia archaeon]|nr:hypothetical protein [Candidatus Lokiarchaeia archaeon]
MSCEHDKNRLLAVCPACDKKIFLHNILQIEASKLHDTTGALTCLTFLHGEKPNRHALTLFLDANLKVRGTQVSDAVIVNRK